MFSRTGLLIASLISFGRAHLPPLTEVSTKCGERPDLRPAIEWIRHVGEPAITTKKWSDHRQNARAKTIDPIPRKSNGCKGGSCAKCSGYGWFGKFVAFGNASSQVTKNGWDGNFHRAHVCTCTAQGGGIG